MFLTIYMHQNLDSFQKKGAFSICFRKRGVSLRKGGGSKLFRYCSDPPPIPPLQIKHKKQHKQPHSIYNTNCLYNKFSFKRSICNGFLVFCFYSKNCLLLYQSWHLLLGLVTFIYSNYCYHHLSTVKWM